MASILDVLNIRRMQIHAARMIARNFALLCEVYAAIDHDDMPQDLKAKIETVVLGGDLPAIDHAGADVSPLELLQIAHRLSALGETGDASRLRRLADSLVAKPENTPKVIASGRDAQPMLPEGWATLGVGDGSGRLFVYGPHDAIKTAQALIIRNEAEFIPVGTVYDAADDVPESAPLCAEWAVKGSPRVRFSRPVEIGTTLFAWAVPKGAALQPQGEEVDNV